MSDGKVRAKAYHPPAECECFVWGEKGGFEYDTTLAAGAYAVVLCANEPFFRAVKTEPTMLGECAGHAGLACEKPVLFAGEVEVNECMKIIGWSIVSGT